MAVLVFYAAPAAFIACLVPALCVVIALAIFDLR
jgi:hypothetical protein